MIITYHGLEAFRIQFGDLVIALNPPSKASKAGSVGFGADIVLISLDHADMNGVDATTRAGKEPFVISGPGEYEVGGVVIEGYASSSLYGGTTRMNTIYKIKIEEMVICFMGANSDAELPQAAQEGIGDIDVLFLPVGGDGVLNPKAAHSVAVHLEPKIIVPMHFDDASLKQFLKEEGSSSASPVEKLTLKRKDLTGKEGEIVVLKSEK